MRGNVEKNINLESGLIMESVFIFQMKSHYIVLDLVKILIKYERLLFADEPLSEKKKKCMSKTVEGSEIYPTYKLTS